MSNTRVSCNLEDVLSCEVAQSVRFVYSRYFVPVQLEYGDGRTPVLPGYKKAFLENLAQAGIIDINKLPRELDAKALAELMKQNDLGAWARPDDETRSGPLGEWGSMASEGAPDENDGLLDELAEVTTRSRSAGDLLRRVGHEVRSSLEGGAALADRPADSATVPLPSNVSRTPREPTSLDQANLLLGLLKSDLGYLFMDRTRIQPDGFRLGEHVFALGLAPGEEVTLEQKTFAKRQTTYEEQDEREQQLDLELASTLTTELQEGFEATKSHNDTTGLSLSHTGQYSSPDFFWGKINASHTIGYTRNVTEASQETSRHSAKDSQSASSKVAAKYRTLHKTEFKVTEERGFESTSKRVIRNPNRYTPITLHYFKILQNLKLTQERYGVRLCWTPSVHDPAASYFTQLGVGKAKIMADAQLTIPPAPQPPVRPSPPDPGSTPVEDKWFYSPRTDADKWGVWGDQRHDYSVDIPFPSDYAWDGVQENISLTVDTQRTDYTAALKGIPIVASSEGGTVLRVIVHIGAPVFLGGPKIFFQVGARFIKVKTPGVTDQAAEDAAYAAAVADYATALRAWEDKRDTIMQDAYAASEAWEAEMLRQLNPVIEMINEVIKAIFPPSVRDELWEIDLWQRLFDWEQASYVAYPSWWGEGAMRDPTKDSSDFVNASWAKLYLPIRVGMERLALRWIFGKSIAGALDKQAEASFDKLIKDISDYRAGSFGDESEVAFGDGDCPSIKDSFQCLATWGDLMPTDGTHIEVIQGYSTAADQSTAREAADEEARRRTALDDAKAELAIKKRVEQHISKPADVHIRLGPAVPPPPG
jgi:hypothetical protein